MFYVKHQNMMIGNVYHQKQMMAFLHLTRVEKGHKEVHLELGRSNYG